MGHPKSKARRWEERRESKKRKRLRVKRDNAARAEKGKKKRHKVIILLDTDGNTLVRVSNAGRLMCGLLTIITLWMLSVGIPYDTVIAAVNGELTQEMEDMVQKLREDIVDAADGHIACAPLFKDGREESRPFEEVVDDPRHILETWEMWKKVTISPRGVIDGIAMVIAAETKGLSGFLVISSNNEGELVPVDSRGGSTVGVPMALHLGIHWEALVRLVSPVVLL